MKNRYFKCLCVTTLISAIIIQIIVAFAHEEIMQDLIIFPNIILYILVMFCAVFIFVDTYIFKEKAYKENIDFEKMSDEFENIYANLEKKDVEKIYEMRKRIIKINIILKVLVIIMSVSVLYPIISTLIFSKFKYEIVWVGVATYFIYLLFSMKQDELNKKNVKKYKKEIISKFIKLYNNKLDYNYENDDTKKKDYEKFYRDAEFDILSINRFHAEDYIEGYIDEKIYVNIADLHVRNVKRSTKRYVSVTLLRGLFVYIHCEKKMNAYLKITSDKIFDKNKNKIEMDSEIFEQYFNVYSDNKILAMTLLTHDVMELLINFYKKYNIPFEIVIKNYKIYIRFFTGNVFEPNINKAGEDKKILYIYYFILQFVTNLSKQIKITIKDKEL